MFSGYPKYESLNVVKLVNQASICAMQGFQKYTYILTIYLQDNSAFKSQMITLEKNRTLHTQVKHLKENIKY